MNAHVFFCLGYRTGDIPNKFWLENLELDHEDTKILDDWGVKELWEKVDKFLSENSLKQTIYSLDENEDLIGVIYEWDKYEGDEKYVIDQQEYQKEVQRLTSIFSFEPSIYFGAEYY
jgi:hypothetical protein